MNKMARANGFGEETVFSLQVVLKKRGNPVN